MKACPWCSNDNQQVFHGGPCPRVEEVEYFENGNVKKIKFRNPTNQIDGATTYYTITWSKDGNFGQTTIYPQFTRN